MADTQQHVMDTGWFEGQTPIHDEALSKCSYCGESHPGEDRHGDELNTPPELRAETYRKVLEALGMLDLSREDMDRVLTFIEKAAPLLELAAKYTSGSKLDKARAAIGLRHG